MGLYNQDKHPPIWLMRQAGRYQSSYQEIRKSTTFTQMCKTPEIAAQLTLNAVEEFDFDAAILFSDILFPLVNLGLDLDFVDGKPVIKNLIQSAQDTQKIIINYKPTLDYEFQKTATIIIREKLAPDKTLIGFVGAPYTLYSYACNGMKSSHNTNAKEGYLKNSFYDLYPIIEKELLCSITAQIKGGADTIAFFDSGVGDLSHFDFIKYSNNALKPLLQKCKSMFPKIKILYYSKNTTLNQISVLPVEYIDIVGIDWRLNILEVLDKLPETIMVQGNIDPVLMTLDWIDALPYIMEYKNHLYSKRSLVKRVIVGLGHGVLQNAKENTVRNFIQYTRNNILF